VENTSVELGSQETPVKNPANSGAGEIASNHLAYYLQHFPAGQWLEIRTFSETRDEKGNSYWITKQEEIPAAVTWAETLYNAGKAVYLGQNPRIQKPASKENVKQVISAYADVDLYKSTKTREEFNAYVETLPFKPSLIVNSGGGLQVIYLFQPSENKELWRAVQEKLRHLFIEYGAGTEVITDEARVLRLTPFCNRKMPDNPRPTAIEYLLDRETPTLEQVAEGLGATLEEGKRLNTARRNRTSVDENGVPKLSGKSPLSPPGALDEGEGRNQAIFDFALALWKKGFMSKDEIRAAAWARNESFAKPLDPGEFDSAVDSAFRYEQEQREEECERTLAELQQEAQGEDFELSIGEEEMLVSELTMPKYTLYGVAEGQIAAIVADGGVGKTTLTRNALLCAAVGRPYLGMLGGGEPMRVALLDFEDDRAMAIKDIRTMCADFDPYEMDLVKKNFKLICDVWIKDQPFKLTDANHWDRLIKELDEFQPQIIVIDTMSEAFVYLDENSNSEMTNVIIVRMKKLANRYGASVVVVHHPNKADFSVSSSNKMRGASSLGNAMRAQYYLSVAEGGGQKQVRLQHCKFKGRKMRDYYLPYDTTGETRWLYEVGEQITRIEPTAEQKFINALFAAIKCSPEGKISRREAKDATGLKEDQFKDRIAPLVENGTIMRIANPGRETYYSLSDSLQGETAEVVNLDDYRESA